MNRRNVLGLLGTGAVGVALAGEGQGRADDDHHNHHEHDDHLKVIAHCAKVCNEAAHHCLEQLKKGGPHADHHARAHEATMDCQAFCTLTAALVARSSPMSRYAHEACANACRDCAAACETHQDAIMKECVESCRACEKACRAMAARTTR